MSLIIGTTMKLSSPVVKFIRTNSAGGKTGNGISYCMKLVEMVVKRTSKQLDLVSGPMKPLP